MWYPKHGEVCLFCGGISFYYTNIFAIFTQIVLGKTKLAFELDGRSPASYTKESLDRKKETHLNELCAIGIKP